MNNRNTLQHAFLHASAPNHLPGSLGQHKEQRHLPQPQSLERTAMMPQPSLLLGNATLSDGTGIHAANYDRLYGGGAGPGRANLFPTLNGPMPMTLQEGSNSMTSSTQQPSHSGAAETENAGTPTSMFPPSGAQPARTGLSEDSEPLSPSSFNW